MSVNFEEFNTIVLCEESQAVTIELRRLGHQAYSCDIQACSGGHPEWHLTMDVFEALKLKKWDMMIGFPPCTYLSSAGLHLCNIEKHGIKAIERIKKRNKAMEFFLDLYVFPIRFICLENPIGHISANILSPTQIIHPYYFGNPEMKRTALWLKNLPALDYKLQDDLFGPKTATNKPEPYQIQLRKKTGKMKKRYFTDSFTNGKLKNSKEKSKTFPGIAKAMAEQWTEHLKTVAL